MIIENLNNEPLDDNRLRGGDTLLNTPSSWLGVYRVERLYGGPEEGGWYWDAHFHLFSVPCWGDEDGQRKRLEKNILQPDHALSSVLSEGLLVIIEEQQVGEYTSKEKPEYC